MLAILKELFPMEREGILGLMGQFILVIGKKEK